MRFQYWTRNTEIWNPTKHGKGATLVVFHRRMKAKRSCCLRCFIESLQSDLWKLDFPWYLAAIKLYHVTQNESARRCSDCTMITLSEPLALSFHKDRKCQEMARSTNDEWRGWFRSTEALVGIHLLDAMPLTWIYMLPLPQDFKKVFNKAQHGKLMEMLINKDLYWRDIWISHEKLKSRCRKT